MEVFFTYNIAMAIFSVVMLVLSFLLTCIHFVEYRGDEVQLKWRGAGRTAGRIVWLCLSWSVILGWAVWCIHDNYPYREGQRGREASLHLLDTAFRAIRERPFDLRCAFNGTTVAADWIKSDMFPCVDVGDTRIWKRDTAYNFGAVNKNEVVLIASAWPTTRTSGIFQNDLPVVTTNLDNGQLQVLAEKLAASVALKTPVSN